MEPRIQYAKTEDGVSIAYASRGQGPALVVLPYAWEQFTLRWQMPAQRGFLDQLGQGRRLVQYDRRGFGLSQREITKFSLETEVADLDAVIRALKLRSVALFASTLAGPGAIAYATRHPRIVSNLILYGTFSRAAEVMPPEQLEAFINLSRTDWNRATLLFADLSSRELHPEEALQMAKDYRQSANGENVAQLLASGVDADDLLSQVRSGTLVIHRRGDATIPFSQGQQIAAKLPNAQFVPLEGTVHPCFLGDVQAVIGVIDDFLKEKEPPAKVEHDEATKPAEADVHTILFTDMESSTATRQRIGDAKAQELVRTHNTIVREALKSHGGSEIKHTGDGIMASFPTATQGLACAVAIQRGVAAHRQAQGGHAEPVEAPLAVYIGLNAGEPIVEENDLFGTSVDLAKRICDHAEPGQILASNVVRELAAGKQFLFADLGETELRGFEDPVRLYELRWRE